MKKKAKRDEYHRRASQALSESVFGESQTCINLLAAALREGQVSALWVQDVLRIAQAIHKLAGDSPHQLEASLLEAISYGGVPGLEGTINLGLRAQVVQEVLRNL